MISRLREAVYAKGMAKMEVAIAAQTHIAAETQQVDKSAWFAPNSDKTTAPKTKLKQTTNMMKNQSKYGCGCASEMLVLVLVLVDSRCGTCSVI